MIFVRQDGEVLYIYRNQTPTSPKWPQEALRLRLYWDDKKKLELGKILDLQLWGDSSEEP